VNNMQSNGKVIKDFQPTVVEEQIADDKVVKAAQQCMLAVTTEGTGKKAFKDALYSAGGKTGTAHVAGKNVSYDDGIYQASFVGYFPFENPIYSCIVVIKTKAHPAKHMGGEVSAPVFREIADKLNAVNAQPNALMLTAALKKDSTAFYYAGATAEVKQVLNRLKINYVDSAQTQDWSSVYNTSNTPVISTRKMAKNSMPNVKGMGLKDALYLLESMNVKVVAKGRGKVINQSIEAGSLLKKGTTVVIELS
jgi:cell division protein FtsI (penicillin-binding protein 3)